MADRAHRIGEVDGRNGLPPCPGLLSAQYSSRTRVILVSGINCRIDAKVEVLVRAHRASGGTSPQAGACGSDPMSADNMMLRRAEPGYSPPLWAIQLPSPSGGST